MTPLRHGRLKKIGQSPAHFAADVEREAAFFEKGSGAHSVLLGGKRLVVWDEKSDDGNQRPRRSKDYSAFAAANAGALVLLPKQYDQVAGMVASVRANPLAMRVLSGVKERTVFWTLNGRECRGTPDVDGGVYVTELKTTKSSDPRRFPWDARKLGYNGALAWYMDGLAMQRGRTEMPEVAYIVAVESSAPYVVTVFRLTAKALDKARRTNRLWFEQLQACEAAGEFPGYSQSIVDLDEPEVEEDAPTLIFGEEEAA